jgi:signal transduction histidine kinase
MNNIYKSATVKLTAWYLVLVMAISLIFSVVVYHFATNTLANTLSAQTQRIYQQFPVFNGNPFFVHDNDVSTGSHNILIDLIYFNLLVLLVAGIASYWLAKWTLRPIQESSENQRRFVADASHELRTPLTSLKMSTEVALSDDSLSKTDLHEALSSNLEETNKLENLLNNLLRLSQLESDEIKQKFVMVPINSLIEDAVNLVKPHAEAKQITISNETKELSVFGDHDSLVQLLVILLDNSIKYSPTLTTVTISSEKNQNYVAISVSDHGIGIEPKALKHVFDRFYRADKARTGNSGFGLGLSIAQHIADLHDGMITLSSTVGKGTKATVQLPSEAIV